MKTQRMIYGTPWGRSTKALSELIFIHFHKKNWDSWQGGEGNDWWILSKDLSHCQQNEAYGEKVLHLTIVENIPKSITSKFYYVVCYTEESDNVITLSICEPIVCLLMHE